ncbi:MAG: hypothetical protein ABF533_00800 [Acetobacter persici]|uniref:hypothetical protein n=1 Tax=Acetobacter persici TaxID=1076596 RepID=UPI0039E7335A
MLYTIRQIAAVRRYKGIALAALQKSFDADADADTRVILKYEQTQKIPPGQTCRAGL